MERLVMALAVGPFLLSIPGLPIASLVYHWPAISRETVWGPNDFYADTIPSLLVLVVLGGPIAAAAAILVYFIYGAVRRKP